MRRRASGFGGSRAIRRTVRRARRRRIRMRRRRVLLMGGMVAIAVSGTATAIKLSQADAERIERHTGRQPEDLSEEQLDQAIAELNIETQELSDTEVAAIEAADAEPATPPAQVASPPTPAAVSEAQPDYIVELERLADLRDRGIITAADFEAKKKQLLGLG